MYKNRFKGFTLIELLVVIAIIGILSAVVLASLNTARSKGSDAAVQSDMSTVRTQSEIDYNNGNTYGGTTTTGPASAPVTVTSRALTTSDPAVASTFFSTDNTALKALNQALNTAQVSSTYPAYTWIGTNTYSIAVPLVSNKSTYWCIDSSGTAATTTATAAAGITGTCP